MLLTPLPFDYAKLLDPATAFAPSAQRTPGAAFAAPRRAAHRTR